MTGSPAAPADEGPGPEEVRPPTGAGAAGSLAAPFRGGALLGFVALAALVAASAALEGGVGDDPARLLSTPLVYLGMAALLGLYAHRVTLCALQDDRPVPWFGDARDETTWMQDVATFAAVLVVSLGPTVLLSIAVGALDGPVWCAWAVVLGGLALASFQFPFAVLSSVLRQGARGAGWSGPLRAWRADRGAARSVALPTAWFLGLFALSFAAAGWLVRPLRDAKPEADHTAARDAGRVLVFALRTAAVWAAFVTFRRAGALGRLVPSVREALE